jgi:hypothetical protein
MLFRLFKTKLSSVDNILLKYVDEDGDLVMLETDIDISHALSLSNVLKIHIFDKAISKKAIDSSFLTDEFKKLQLDGSLKLTLEAMRDKIDLLLKWVDKQDVLNTAKKQLTKTDLAEFLPVEELEEKKESIEPPKPKSTPKPNASVPANVAPSASVNVATSANQNTPSIRPNAQFYPPQGVYRPDSSQPSFRPQDSTQAYYRPQDPQPSYRPQDPSQAYYRPQDPQQVYSRPYDPQQMNARPQDPQHMNARPYDPQQMNLRPQDPQHASYTSNYYPSNPNAPPQNPNAPGYYHR